MNQQDTLYKNHIIRVQPHQERCSEYAFDIIDPEGIDIKHVDDGGDTKEKAIAKAQEMIDVDLAFQNQ